MRLTQSKWIKPFLKSIHHQFYLLISVLFIFGLLIWLTRSPFLFYSYASQLSIFIWLCAVLIQWFQYKKRVERVKTLRKNQTTNFNEDEVHSIAEAYEMQYRTLEREFELFKATTKDKEKEQMDYFTLWLHQIKTPISVMSLILQRDQSETKEKQQMEQELIYLNNYTHMALNYLKLEETGKEMDLEEVTLDSIIKEIVKKNALLFIYNEIRLDYEPIEETVLTDWKWLQVLVEQILSNSLKYTPAGTIRIYWEESNRLVIEDTGRGIRKEELPKIFEKGYTGLNGRLHEKSTGLGLFLSRKICQRLGHVLTIESEVDVGTKARIDFTHSDLKIFD